MTLPPGEGKFTFYNTSMEFYILLKRSLESMKKAHGGPENKFDLVKAEDI